MNKIIKRYKDNLFEQEYSEGDISDGYYYSAEYYTDQILHIRMFFSGKKHKINGPATIKYFKSGKIEEEKFFIKGILSRLDGPSVIKYFECGKIKEEKFFIDGRLSRLDGPSITSYNKNGAIIILNHHYNDIYFKTLKELQIYAKMQILS